MHRTWNLNVFEFLKVWEVIGSSIFTVLSLNKVRWRKKLHMQVRNVMKL